jgi:hypothetical protein
MVGGKRGRDKNKGRFAAVLDDSTVDYLTFAALVDDKVRAVLRSYQRMVNGQGQNGRIKKRDGHWYLFGAEPGSVVSPDRLFWATVTLTESKSAKDRRFVVWCRSKEDFPVLALKLNEAVGIDSAEASLPAVFYNRFVRVD